MQARQLAAAIAVALDVQARFPDYPQLERNILAPALAHLRRSSERADRVAQGLPALAAPAVAS